jgi:hypothetical protein
MTALQYGIYILISRPRFDEKLQVWLPYASVSWDGTGKFHYHQLKDLKGTFQTEEEALAFGYDAAREWISEPQKTIEYLSLIEQYMRHLLEESGDESLKAELDYVVAEIARLPKDRSDSSTS